MIPLTNVKHFMVILKNLNVLIPVSHWSLDPMKVSQSSDWTADQKVSKSLQIRRNNELKEKIVLIPVQYKVFFPHYQ